MKYEEPESMKIIHSIRLKHYREVKGLSVDKKIAYIHAKAKRILNICNLRTASGTVNLQVHK